MQCASCRKACGQHRALFGGRRLRFRECFEAPIESRVLVVDSAERYPLTPGPTTVRNPP